MGFNSVSIINYKNYFMNKKVKAWKISWWSLKATSKGDCRSVYSDHFRTKDYVNYLKLD